jgi:hypothetical protein
MSWHHIRDEETVATKFELVDWVDRHGRSRTCIGKEPTGETVSKTHSIWRCGNCRALAVTSSQSDEPGKCQKCKGTK